MYEAAEIEQNHVSRLVILLIPNDDVINWNIFRVTGPLCGEFTGHVVWTNAGT